jgi:polysaccharide biosynthesis/export protein
MNAKLFVFRLFYLSLISLALISCISQKKVKYIQDEKGVPPVNEYLNIKPDYRVKPGDRMIIRILTLDQKSNQVFTDITGASGGVQGGMDYDLAISGYMVNDSGYISFPLLGNFYANGLTTNEIEAGLNKKVAELVTESRVVVRLVMFNITVLGEVKIPSKFTVYNNRANIFEAIAQVGDITSYGNRSNVKIIRREGNINRVITVDLLDKNILSSPYYYLNPNDIIYVEPLKSKMYAFDTFPYYLVFSAIGVVLLLGSYLK